MFEAVVDRTERAAALRARASAAELAERLRAELPGDILVEAAGGDVRLAGRGIGARFALDPALRWLLARIRI